MGNDKPQEGQGGPQGIPVRFAPAKSGGQPGAGFRNDISAPDSSADRRLVTAIVAGDDAALGALYDRHSGRLMATALRILRVRRDAEDLIHDVFVEAWQRAGSYDPSRGTVYSWLAVRLRSRAVDRLRALQKNARYLQAEKSEPTSVADNAALRTDCTRARRALASLPAAQREVIELGYFRGMSCSEISRRCEIPLGTVKSRLAGALNKLRRHLVLSVESGS